MPDLAVGDVVIGKVGRIHGARCVVERIVEVPAPSGARVKVLELRRPRAGLTYAFPLDVRLADEEAPAKPEPTDAGFVL